MSRYEIQNDIIKNNGKTIVNITYNDIEPTHLYRNIYYKDRKNNTIIYEQDRCLNKYDVNESILNKIIIDRDYNKVWIIDPKYMTLDMAIKIAKIGKGKHLPSKFQRINEIDVLRYLYGERGFINNSNKFSNVISKSYEILNDTDEYVHELTKKYNDLILKEEKEYLNEEKRALLEEEDRLDGKNEYCINIMRDIVVAKNNLRLIKNKK